MKQIISNYTFNAAAKTVTLTDFSTVRLDRLQLIVDTTANTILYNFADSSVATATVATNVITLSTVGSAASADKLQIVYDTLTSDPTYDTQPVSGTFWQATQPVSGTVTANVGTTNGLALDATLTGGNAEVQGNVAAGATDAGNPVKAGGKYLSTPPTLTTGQRGDLSVDQRGSLRVNLTFTDVTTPVAPLGDNVDGVVPSGSANKMAVQNRATVFNGTSWDRQYGDATNGAWVNIKNSIPLAATQSGTWNLNNISGTITLPTGAATAAKQPALGAAGSPSADVLTVQGVSSMTALKVDNSAVNQPVLNTNLEASFTTTTVQAVAATDVSNYRSVSVHVTSQGTSSTITFQQSNDNTNWVPLILTNTSVGGTQATQASSTTASGVVYGGVLSARYFRLNVTGISAGTTAGVVEFSAFPAVTSMTVTNPSGQNIGVGATQTGTWTVQPGNTANTTPWLTTIQPGSNTNGWTPQRYAAQTTTVQTVKGTAGLIGGWHFFNPSAAVAYVQIFDVASATTVTLGTTTPTLAIGIAAGGAAYLEPAAGLAMANGIKLACTTTSTGSTAPATGLELNIFYK